MKKSKFFASVKKIYKEKKRKTFPTKCWDQFLSLFSPVAPEVSSASCSPKTSEERESSKLPFDLSQKESFFPFSTIYQNAVSLSKPTNFAKAFKPEKHAKNSKTLKFTKAAKGSENLEKEIEKNLFPECREFFIVFVNGHLEKQLSKTPKEAKLLFLEEAFLEFYPFFQDFSSFSIKKEKNPFFLMNLALCEKGAFLYVLENTKLPPLQILSIETTQIEQKNQKSQRKQKNLKKQKVLSLPTIQLYLGAGSKLDIVHTKISLQKKEEKQLVSTSLFFVLEEKSQCDYQEITIASPSALLVSAASKGSQSFTTLRALVKKEAKFFSKYISNQDGDFLDQKIFLKEEKATAELFGLSWMTKENKTYVYNKVEHLAKKTFSKQLFKTIAEDKSLFHLLGHIVMHKQAEKSEARQLNHNLLLSDQAAIFSQPYMDIFIDDVKASHGCTTANFPENKMFYLQSRGILEKTAKKLLLEAFCKEVINQIHIKSVEESVSKDLMRR